MARMPDFFMETEQRAAAVGRGITGLFPHHHREPDTARHGIAAITPQTPATRPATITAAPAAAPQQEDTMSLSTIAADIKGAIDNADEWVKQVTETHLPAILAQAQKYENSPVVQALEAAFLPPALEQQIANMITELAKTYPAQQLAAPVQAQQQAPQGVSAGQ